MPKISQFDRANTKALQAAMNAALQAVAADFGIAIKPAGGSIGTTSTMLKFECSTIAASGEVLDAYASSLAMFAPLHDLPADVYGKTFTYQGEPVRLVGYNHKSPKYPFIGEKAGGKRFKYTEQAVHSLKVKASA